MSKDTPQSVAREVVALAARATAGPWSRRKPSVSGLESGATFFAPGVMVCAVARGQGVYADPPGGSFPAADQDFIAHARTSAPLLARAYLELCEAVREWDEAHTEFLHSRGASAPCSIRFSKAECRLRALVESKP